MSSNKRSPVKLANKLTFTPVTPSRKNARSPSPGKSLEDKRTKLHSGSDLSICSSEYFEEESKMDEIKSMISKMMEVMVTKEDFAKVNPILSFAANLEKRDKMKNIIISGISEEEKEYDEIKITKVRDVFKKCGVANLMIDDIFRLGKPCAGKTRPMLVKLCSMLDKRAILRGTKALKGTNIYINHDLTKEERNIEKTLRTKLNEIKSLNKNAKGRIDKGKLTIIANGVTSNYTVVNGVATSQ